MLSVSDVFIVDPQKHHSACFIGQCNDQIAPDNTCRILERGKIRKRVRKGQAIFVRVEISYQLVFILIGLKLKAVTRDVGEGVSARIFLQLIPAPPPI